MGDVFQAYADALFRTASNELAHRALDDAPSHPTPAPRVLAPWTPPTEHPPPASAPLPTSSATREAWPPAAGGSLASAAISHTGSLGKQPSTVSLYGLYGLPAAYRLVTVDSIETVHYLP